MFLFLSCLFLLVSSSLLHSLILLEILSFSVLAVVSSTLAANLSSDFLILMLFSVFVMEGVIAISGMITLVTHTGSDMVSSSSFSKW